MTDRLPESGSAFEAEGIPDPGDDPSGLLDGEETNQVTVPGDSPGASMDFGTTADEEIRGESLDGRLSRETPEVLDDASVAVTPMGDDLDTPGHEPGSVGRLVQDDEGSHADTTAETVAHDLGTDLGGFSAEESAMHVTSGDEEQ